MLYSVKTRTMNFKVAVTSSHEPSHSRLSHSFGSENLCLWLGGNGMTQDGYLCPQVLIFMVSQPTCWHSIVCGTVLHHYGIISRKILALVPIFSAAFRQNLKDNLKSSCSTPWWFTDIAQKKQWKSSSTAAAATAFSSQISQQLLSSELPATLV